MSQPPATRRSLNTKTTIRFDRSALLLILSNAFAIVVAVAEHWSLSDVIWIYWGQSVVIGFFSWLRILCLRQFSTEDVKINDVPVEPTKATQRQLALYFLIHYGGFHALYFITLCGELSRPNMTAIVICVGVLAINHAFSFWYNLEKDIRRKPKIWIVMVFPYARIIPMHLIILLAGSFFVTQSTVILILFLFLKTLADLLMHQIEHYEQFQCDANDGGNS